jgi:3-isopropylmalate/(R)-2-methylmalate dehydratase small subunit
MDEPGYSLSVDVSESTVRDQDGFMAKFPLDPFQRRTLMEGLDPIALALEDLPAIERYEAGHPIPSAWARPGEER